MSCSGQHFLVTKRTESHTVITMHNNRTFPWGRHCTNHPLQWLQPPSPTLLVNFLYLTHHSPMMLFWFVYLLWIVSPMRTEVPPKQGPCQAFTAVFWCLEQCLARSKHPQSFWRECCVDGPLV